MASTNATPPMPPAAPPGGAYTPVVVHQGVAWVSAQLPRRDGMVVHIGQVGGDIDLAAAQDAARLSALQCLAALADALGGLDRVERLLHVTGYVAAAPGFVDFSAVVDGASRCFMERLGERGRHARSSVGVAALPRGVAVEIAVTAAVRG